MKDSIINTFIAYMIVRVASRAILFQLHSYSAVLKSQGKKAGVTAGRPFCQNCFKTSGGSFHPELDREIVGAEIADRVSETDLAVGAIKVKRLAHHAVGEKKPATHRARVCARMIGGVAFAAPPTHQTGR